MKDKTNFKDINNNDIFVGDKVSFKFYGHYFIEVVSKTKNNYYPFDPDIKVESGFFIDPKKCEVV